MYRPKADILKAKQLKKLKLKKKLKAIIKFVKKKSGKCYKIVTK